MYRYQQLSGEPGVRRVGGNPQGPVVSRSASCLLGLLMASWQAVGRLCRFNWRGSVLRAMV